MHAHLRSMLTLIHEFFPRMHHNPSMPTHLAKSNLHVSHEESSQNTETLLCFLLTRGGYHGSTRVIHLSSLFFLDIFSSEHIISLWCLLFLFFWVAADLHAHTHYLPYHYPLFNTHLPIFSSFEVDIPWLNAVSTITGWHSDNNISQDKTEKSMLPHEDEPAQSQSPRGTTCIYWIPSKALVYRWHHAPAYCRAP